MHINILHFPIQKVETSQKQFFMATTLLYSEWRADKNREQKNVPEEGSVASSKTYGRFCPCKTKPLLTCPSEAETTVLLCWKLETETTSGDRMASSSSSWRPMPRSWYSCCCGISRASETTWRRWDLGDSTCLLHLLTSKGGCLQEDMPAYKGKSASDQWVWGSWVWGVSDLLLIALWYILSRGKIAGNESNVFKVHACHRLYLLHR